MEEYMEAAYGQSLEEDYIDVDISSTTFFCFTTNSSPDSREFEFHMSFNPAMSEPIASPADELFYKGKLLPLHLPPRLQMVQKLLQDPSATTSHDKGADPTDGNIAIPAAKTVAGASLESWDIFPPNSCYHDGKLNQPLPKRSWCNKLKLIRQSPLGVKLRASREYLKSLFTRSVRSEETCAVRKAKQIPSVKAARRNTSGQTGRKGYESSTTRSTDGETTMEEDEDYYAHGLSFLDVINSSTSLSSSSLCSSSSSCLSRQTSYGHCETPTLKRSSSVSSDADSSILSAIAYCKKTQQLDCARRSFISDAGCLTSSPSKMMQLV